MYCISIATVVTGVYICNMYACMYVHIYVCTCVYMYVCIYVCTCVYMYVRVYICTCVYMYVRVYM